MRAVSSAKKENKEKKMPLPQSLITFQYVVENILVDDESEEDRSARQRWLQEENHRLFRMDHNHNFNVGDDFVRQR